MENNNGTPTILPTCTCCFPAQTLVVTGQRAFCPLTERIYEDAGNGGMLRHPTATRANGNVTDFYPGRTKQRGEVAPLAINPAEDRFGA